MQEINLNVTETGCQHSPLLIGYQGENEVTRVIVDYSAWTEEFGAGSLALEVMRSGDEIPYLAPLTFIDDKAVWLVSNVDTGAEGVGAAGFIYTVGDQIKKSAVFQFYVGRDIGGDPGERPDPYEGLLAHIEKLVKEAEDNAAAAETAQGAAETAQTAAEAARDAAASSATDAAGSATTASQQAQAAATARTAAETAQQAAETAQGAAETAQTAAEAARDAAASSATDAAGSATTASQQAQAAATARTAAETAQQAAETAQGAAETARDAAASSATGAAGSATTATQQAQAAATERAAAEAAKQAAETAQGAAEAAQTAAETAQGAAETAQTAAEAARDEAASSATGAAGSATTATQQAQAAATARAAAETAQTAAEAARDAAASSATDAAGSATTATEQAQAAATERAAAEAAKQAAETAQGAAEAAQTAAETAQGAAETAQTAAEAARDEAASSATGAAGSATTATQQAQAAATARTAAETAQQAAETAKNYAQTFTGAPRAAGSSAQMTDTSLIYVYTGTTSGTLTTGHWYYWDGSAWTDGGVYNSSAVQTDTTLTVSGAPADAKATGDAVNDLKSALYGEYVAVSLPVTTNNKFYLGAVGESITTNDGNGFIYPAIDLTEHVGKYVVLTLTSPNTGSQRICAICDGAGVIKDRYREKDIIDNNGVVQFAITADQKYLYMSFGKNAVVDVKIKNVPSIIEEIDTVYVSTTGNDNNDGSKSFPFATIAKALSTGAEFIKVFAGQYAGFGIQSRNKPVQIALAEMNTFNDDSLNKIEITSGYSAQNAIMIQDAVSVKLSDIYVHGLPGNCFYFSQVENIECISCHASTNSGTDTMGFAIRYSNGKFIDCEADHAVKDGFNIHGFGDTVFINCKGHDNGDDGISHHDGSTGYIQGGEYYNNNKGGIISPYGGAIVSIDGAVCHDNARYGIFAGYLDSTHNTSRGCVSNSVMKNNGTYDFYIGNCTLKAWNNIYTTKEVNNANLTEY